MKFRFHRGGFEESMQTTVDVETMNKLLELLSNPNKIEFEKTIKDERNGWDTHYVIADGKIVGMSDGKF